MKLLALYWSFLAIGYILSDQLRRRGKRLGFIDPAMMGSVYVMCFIMGVRMGVNEQVTSNLGTIGLMSLVVTVFCIAGSMVAIALTRKIFRMNRYGDVITAKAGNQVIKDKQNQESGEDNKLDLKSTIIILILVAAGMVAGYIASGIVPQILADLDFVTAKALMVLLCILLFFVGFSLGATGGIFANIKEVGLKVLAFPVAAILGSAIMGTITCMIMGFSAKEGLAISIGFGWYTYAPVVIAGAGNQFIIASAVSFMHNVIREVAGIVLIPTFAKKIGYIESAGVPGVAAMDVCLPIVDRSCRPDTVVYSFAIGLVMCLTTSMGVPLVMGL